MFKKYSPKLKFNEYIVPGDHGRTGVFVHTEDCEIAYEKVKNGWICESLPDGFWLRAPDISLVDITEPFRIYQMNDDRVNFALYKYVKKLEQRNELKPFFDVVIKNHQEKYRNFDFYISEGKVLEAEVRIGGSDERIHFLKEDVIFQIQKMRDWDSTVVESMESLGETRDLRCSQKKFDPKTQNFIDHLNNLNSTLFGFTEPINHSIVKGIIEQLPKFDYLIFAPTGCYRYISSFLNSKTISKIILWEIHIDKNQKRNNRMFNKNLKNKTCLIIDKTYTGKTLDRIAKIVLHEGGKPTKLGLFPKNRKAIKSSDYVLLLDRIFKSDTMDLSDLNWAETYYKKILSKQKTY